MTDRPLVSVIVPVYNGARFLGEALHSICSQDYEPYEIILVDDGSTDETAVIARSYPSVRYMRQANQGVAVARNVGMTAARGAFLAFQDHDDLMHATRLNTQVGYLLAHPEVGCALCRHEILLPPGMPPPARLVKDSVYGDLGGVEPTSAVVRTALARKIAGFDPAYPPAEVLEWLGRLRDTGVLITVVPEILVTRRIHEANMSHQSRLLRDNFLRSLKARMDRRRQPHSTGTQSHGQ